MVRVPRRAVSRDGLSHLGGRAEDRVTWIVALLGLEAEIAVDWVPGAGRLPGLTVRALRGEDHLSGRLLADGLVRSQTLGQPAHVALQGPEQIDLGQLQRTFTLRSRDGFVENFGPALIRRLRGPSVATSLEAHLEGKDGRALQAEIALQAHHVAHRELGDVAHAVGQVRDFRGHDENARVALGFEHALRFLSG